MKKQFYAHITVLSLLLVACGNQTDERNATEKLDYESFQPPLEQSLEQDQNSVTEPPRISYQDFMAQNQNESEEADATQEDTLFTSPGPELLATYSTPLQSSSDERVNNIEIVCERLNHYILQPYETFSYNTVTGPFGPSDGFEEAPILLSDGTHAEGYGGGVCQLSSTLYNVVKNIENVEITERHHHSVPVSYVPEGEDATVSLQSGLDFQFKNNNEYSIQFEAKCDDENVTVWAYKTM